MDTTNLGTANRLKNLALQLGKLQARLTSLPIVNIKMTDVSGNEIDLSVISLQKDSSLAAPNAYQTLASDLIDDVTNAIGAEIVSINAEIAGLSC